MNDTPLPLELEGWFAQRGWRIRSHQRAMFAAAETGDHALLVADTGAGKTLAETFGISPTASVLIGSESE